MSEDGYIVVGFGLFRLCSLWPPLHRTSPVVHVTLTTLKTPPRFDQAIVSTTHSVFTVQHRGDQVLSKWRRASAAIAAVELPARCLQNFGLSGTSPEWRVFRLRCSSS